MSETEEYDTKKKAIFEGMGKRGRQHILKIGYENWNPFEEPKDPRERIFGSDSLRASALVEEFCKLPGNEESVAVRKDLFDLCSGLFQEKPAQRPSFSFAAGLEKEWSK